MSFTYPEVGATRDGEPLPDGYDHVRVRERIGHGRAAFTAVVEGVVMFDLHRSIGLRVATSQPRAAVGVRVTSTLGVGPVGLRIPCEVVWVLDEDRRGGYAYGTLAGHPERGEESFVAELDDHDDLWFTVTAFSRAAAWYARLGGPLTRAAQAVATRRYVTAARRLAARASHG
ncbi:DUF1990 family protein [Jiangella alkaliphila]|uniref:Uncharacterized protein, UPF0548 family n=1 Tax=Jiangella alkaliphila TaxID=419479 RepID=A0A1H2HSA4_9ACTN|nr:DUF1990 domain-containing protein [Jiangella alkaliphila]SDU34761.1 Uncharacterized protein, UPF0548 family [Jiangella alkaliphila]